jgi:hypothetical protein
LVGTGVGVGVAAGAQAPRISEINAVMHNRGNRYFRMVALLLSLMCVR